MDADRRLSHHCGGFVIGCVCGLDKEGGEGKLLCWGLTLESVRLANFLEAEREAVLFAVSGHLWDIGVCFADCVPVEVN